MTTFKLLALYLKEANQLTYQNIAEKLHVQLRTIKAWAKNGYKVGATDPNHVYRSLFTDSSLIDGFINFIQPYGYDIPDSLLSAHTIDVELFKTFFEEFLIYDSQTNHKNTISSFKLEAKQHHTTENVVGDKDYFCQKLYSKKNDAETFNVSTPDFSCFKSNNRILIEGPGGQGKSLFLSKICGKALSSDNYSAAIVIKLLDLVSLNEENLIHNYNQRCEKCRYIASYFHKLFDKKLISEEVWDYVKNNKPIQKPILLSLDGLNELFCSSNISKISSISNEIRYITDKWESAQIIITTRLSEDAFNYNNLDYISKYKINYLSGVPEEDYSNFINRNKKLSNEIKEFAKIPLYFKSLVELEDTDKLNSKYDVLFQIYSQRYKQSMQDANSLFAFYILSPILAQKVNKNSGNRIHKTEILEIAQKISESNWSLLLQTGQFLCGDKSIITTNDVNIDDTCRILLQKGPFISLTDGYFRFFHDEIRDFLLTYSTLLFMFTLKTAAKDDNISFKHIDNINVDFNLSDNPAEMLRQQLGLIKGVDIEAALTEHYGFLKDINKKVTPAKILYAHTAFLISDYLTLGSAAVEPVHNILFNFQRRVNSNVRNKTLEKIFVELSDIQILKCKKALIDILSKHCEFYRIKKDYSNGLNCVEIAEAIFPKQDAIINQKAKLYIAMHRDYIINNSVNLSEFDFSNPSELYVEGIKLLEEAAENDFNLSVNLLSMLYSVPAPYLLEDEKINIDIDCVKAFRLNYNLIFTDKHSDYIIREIDYTVRQAVSLLLKGYVKCNPNIDCFCGDELGPDTIIPGDKNPLKIDSTTIEFAKELIAFADGTNRASMNFFRGMMLFHEGNKEQAKELFLKETGTVLKDIVLNYCFNIKYDFDSIFANLKENLYKDDLNYADRCHALFWYCDLKNLEIAFNSERTAFFDEFEKELPDKWKKLVKQLTL